MNKLLETCLRRLVAEGWQLDPLADLDDLLKLNALASAAVGTDVRDPRYVAALHPELHLAGQVFRRVSIGARMFAEERIGPWYRGDERMSNLAWCWLMAHCADPVALWRYQSSERDAFHGTLLGWLRGLAIPEEDLLAGVSRWLAMGQEARKRAADLAEAEAMPQDLSSAIEELAAEYGKGDLHHWIWEATESEVALLWDRMQERKAAERGDYVSGGSDKFHEAMRAYRTAEAAFVSKIRQRGGGRVRESQPHPRDDGPRSGPQPASPREAQPSREQRADTETPASTGTSTESP